MCLILSRAEDYGADKRTRKQFQGAEGEEVSEESSGDDEEEAGEEGSSGASRSAPGRSTWVRLLDASRWVCLAFPADAQRLSMLRAMR